MLEKPLDLSQSFKRCIVQNIETRKAAFEKILNLLEKSSQLSAKCCLKGIWYETEVEINDVVSVQSVWSQERNMFIVSTSSGLIVTSPDTLISGTRVVGSLFCPRKSVIAERFQPIAQGDAKVVRNFVSQSFAIEFIEITS